MKDKPKGLQNRTIITSYATGYGLAIKFTFILACPIFSSFACGFWLDEQLGTTPWLMFGLVVIGFVFSIYAVFRVATQVQDELNKR